MWWNAWMKFFSVLVCCMICSLQPSWCAGKAIPFEEIFLNVRIGQIFGKRIEQPRLSFSVDMMRDRENPEGSTSISIRSIEFGRAGVVDEMSEKDVEALLKVGKAAKEFQGTGTVVSRASKEGRIDTSFRGIVKDGKRIVRVARDGASLEFRMDDVEKVGAAMAEAEAAKAWYDKLLAADEIAEETPEASPPRSDFCAIRSGDGYVSCKGFYYTNSAAANWSPNPQHLTMPRLMLLEKGGNAGRFVGGEWMEALFEDVGLAIDAAANGKVILLKGKGDKRIEYLVRSNPTTKEADITLSSPVFATGGSIGKPELAEIQRVKRESEAKLEWFTKNQSLLFTAIPKKKGILSIFD